MNRREDTCRRFHARIDDLLADLTGASSDGELVTLRRHGRDCPACSETWATARESDGALSRWIAPEPPPHLAERIVERILTETRTQSVHCLQLTDELSALMEGDLAPERADLLHQHAGHCAPCQHRLRVAGAVDALLATWVAPEPAAHLADQLVTYATTARDRRPASEARTEVTHAHGPTSTRSRRSLLRPRRDLIAWSAAAGLLIALGMRLADTGRDPDVPHEHSGIMTLAMEQIEHERELRLMQVRYEQFPAGIGDFDATPAVLDRARRPTGNAFHDALRRAASEARLLSASDADRLTSDRP